MSSTLLKPDEVERIQEWINTEYRKRHRLMGGDKWNGKVPIPQFIEQLNQVLTAREKKKDLGKVSKLEAKDIQRKLESIESDLQQADNGDGIYIEDVLRYYSTDPKTRFDIQFVRSQQLRAEDSLGLWVYIPFVILFSFFLIEGKSLGNGFWMTSTLLDKFLDEEFTQSDDLRYKKVYYDIASEEEFWGFLEGPLIESLWQQDDDQEASEVKANQFVQHSNMPVGAMRIRQLRIEGTSCGRDWDELIINNHESVPPEKLQQRLDDFNLLCYGEYVPLGLQLPATTDRKSDGGSYVTIDRIHDGAYLQNEQERCRRDPDCHNLPSSYFHTTPLDPRNVNPDHLKVIDAYRYRSCNELNSTGVETYNGKGGLYGCDGFAQIIPFDSTLEEVQEVIGLLRDGIESTHYNVFSHGNETTTVKWIDRQTRGIAVEMFLYNQNIELLSRQSFFVELTAGGAWIPLHATISFRLFYWDEHPLIYHIFYMIYFTWVVGYIGVWCRFVWTQTISYRQQMLQANEDSIFLKLNALKKTLNDFWVWYDLCNLGLFAVAWGMRFYIIYKGTTNNCLLQNLHYPDGYDEIAYLTQFSVNINAINAMLVYLRIFYFLKLNPRLNLLTRTIGFARDEIVAILVIFTFVFVAFALMCYVVYGHVDENYRSLGDSARSLMLMLLGDFDYVALRESHRIFTPIFFALFQILAVILLFNMIIAVLGDAFNTVQENKYEGGDLTEALIKQQEKKNNQVWTPKGQEQTWKVPPHLFRNSLMVEFIYWFKYITLMFKGCCGMPAEELALERKKIADQNPRIYWANLERSYYVNKHCTRFIDNLQLTSKVLDDYIEERFGKDQEYFFYDKDTGEEGVVLKSAKKTRVQPKDMVQDMMEFHHEWETEMRRKTHTGNEEDYYARRKLKQEDKLPTKKDEIDELFTMRYASTPERRWEEQKAKIDQLKVQLDKIVPPVGATGREKSGLKRSAKSDLETKIKLQVEFCINDLIRNQINEMVDKLMEHEMKEWISGLVTDAESDNLNGTQQSARNSGVAFDDFPFPVRSGE
eukprot:TRINITY_DN9632_c1_g1_i1.p1 TRINITY_DN9632_c1_g1~~TRINITY_DN9632_c1_g1_i1.p1  ORF type:complete len:1043 (+),score=225.70 TRINITY_DN9632_c1_g1_i1:103-3231(+)